MTLQVIKETKRYGRTHAMTDARTDARTHANTDNAKTVYLTQTKGAGGLTKWLVSKYNPQFSSKIWHQEEAKLNKVNGQ